MTSLFDQFLAFLYAAVLAAVPLLYGTLGTLTLPQTDLAAIVERTTPSL